MNITGKHQGDLVLNENLELTGMVCGDLVVSSGFRANVLGTVTGRIVVEKDGLLILDGLVSNGLTNNGGTAKVYGCVEGGINDISGNTIIHPNAKIE